jgi:large-conductance mechanosensitive channel
MKKIKLTIIIIYVISFIIISGLTIFLIVKNVEQGISLYFREKSSQEIQLPLQEQEVDKLINDLKRYKFIE